MTKAAPSSLEQAGETEQGHALWQERDWQAAFDAHGQAVFAFLASRTRRREDAEDLLQETFVRAIRATGSLRDGAKLRSYLMTIAHNLMINQYRKKKPLLFSEGGDATEGLEERLESGNEPTDSGALLDSLESQLANVLEQMTPTLRQAFELAILHQRSYDEISRETGWTKGQVRVNVFRARRFAIGQLGDWLPTS